jgi:hypothetical protein
MKGSQLQFEAVLGLVSGLAVKEDSMDPEENGSLALGRSPASHSLHHPRNDDQLHNLDCGAAATAYYYCFGSPMG